MYESVRINEQEAVLSMNIFFLKMTHVYEPGDVEVKKARRRRGMQKRRVGVPPVDQNETTVAVMTRDKATTPEKPQVKRRVTQSDANLDNANVNNNKSKSAAAPRDSNNKVRLNASIPLSRSNQNQKAVGPVSSKVHRAVTDAVTSPQRNMTAQSYPIPSPTSAPVSESSSPQPPLYISLGDIKEATAEILRSYSGVVIIANVGAWYNSRERFRKELPVSLCRCSDSGSIVVVVQYTYWCVYLFTHYYIKDAILYVRTVGVNKLVE